MICGVFAHLTPPPFNFTVPGNAFSAAGPALPTAARMALGIPVSPDEFTSEDTLAAGNLPRQLRTFTSSSTMYKNTAG